MSIDSSPLPYPKTDKVPVPANEDTRQYVSANDWNTVCTVLDSVRDAFTLSMSTVDLANAGATVTDAAGDFTYGDIIIPVRSGLSMAGVRVYWPGGHGALTYKLGLYNAGGLVTSVNVPINAAGVYTGAFSVPQTLAPWVYYRVSAYETTGARNIYITGASLSAYTTAQLLIGDINGKMIYPGYFRVSSCYTAGDANPTSADATLIAGIVEPIFQ